jgi:hypothetical protein
MTKRLFLRVMAVFVSLRTMHAQLLAGSGLCLTVGNESDSTFDETHRWRTLFMAHCDEAKLSHSQWHFVVPN